MGRIGKISSIKRSYPGQSGTVESTLANIYGFNRMPGTGIRRFPFKMASGLYKTGLEDKPDEKERLEKATKLNLSPDSDFYDCNSSAKMHVESVKLDDGDNIFNLENPLEAITYYWLSVHPCIASSLEEYDRGDYPSNTEFYVNNSDVEIERKYQKEVAEAKAIGALNVMSPTKMRQVARLLGFPVSDDSKPEHVFVLINGFIKEGIGKTGPYKGVSTVNKFNQYANLKDEDLYVTDLFEQALKMNIFREAGNGAIMKGDSEQAKNRAEYIEMLKSKKGQEVLLNLEKDLQIKESMVK